MDARRVELLQRMPVFGALDERALHLLVDGARKSEVAAGNWFFREGDEARSMFVLESGRAVVMRQWQGREIELNRFGPGDCFGEMALMDLHPRSAGVRAIEPCTAIEFGPDEMLRLQQADLEQFTLLQMNLGRELSRRLRATDEMLFRAAMGELPPAPPAAKGCRSFAAAASGAPAQPALRPHLGAGNPIKIPSRPRRADRQAAAECRRG